MGKYSLARTLYDDRDNALRKCLILRVVSRGYSLSRGAMLAGIGQATAYRWERGDPDFRGRLALARKAGIQHLEDEAVRRATQGVTRTKGVYYRGQRVGQEVITEFSDILLMQQLRARDPDKYREHSPGALQVGNVNVVVLIPDNGTAPRQVGQGQGQPEPDIIDIQPTYKSGAELHTGDGHGDEGEG